MRVRAEARLAHEILAAIWTTVGLLLVLVAPVAVSLSRAGAVLSVVSCVVVMLRSRHHRLRAEVLVGLASGALVVTGLVLLVATVVRQGASVRSARVGDLVEGAALAALLPALVLASGVATALGG